jgi:hypothetical protein
VSNGGHAEPVIERVRVVRWLAAAIVEWRAVSNLIFKERILSFVVPATGSALCAAR